MKVAEDKGLEHWYGKDLNGKDVTIHEVDLVTYIDDFFKTPELVDHIRVNPWVELPDKTRLVCSLKAAEDQGWTDIYDVLKQFYI